MWWHSADGNPLRPSLSIVLIIAFHALVAGLALLLLARVASVEYFSDQAFPDADAPQVLSILLTVAVLFIVCAIGLFRLRNWSRHLTLFLSSAGLLIGTLGVLLY